MKASLTGASDIGKQLRKELTDLINQVEEDTYTIAKQVTPVRSGNARNHWEKQGNSNGFTVENRVPYIERLEAGRSKQAPKGMIMPTLTQIKGKYK